MKPIIDKVDDKFLEDRPMLTINKKGKVVCKHAFSSFDIQPDGNVTPCCYLPKAIMGNLNEQSIPEIWNSEKWQDFRSDMACDGARSTCKDCCVLQGMNSWDRLDFYKEFPEDSHARKNSELNEKEIYEGKSKLESLPRRVKYTQTYACNLTCYHCLQDKYRMAGAANLSEGTYQHVRSIMPMIEVFVPFGGEPFISPHCVKLMEEMVLVNPNAALFTTTNANKISDKVWKILDDIKIAKIAISWDGHTKDTYEKYRVDGHWETFRTNIKKIAKLRDRKGFDLVFNTSINNETYKELPSFIQECVELKAKGRPVHMYLNSNNDKKFWEDHLKLSDEQVKEYKQLILDCLKRDDLEEDTRNALKDMLKKFEISSFNEYQYFMNMTFWPTIRRILTPKGIKIIKRVLQRT